MGRRDIPTLRDLCLRSVGAKGCNAEKVFRPKKGGNQSSASLLLRSFHADESISRIPTIGKGASRRVNANDVDLNHPFIAVSNLLMQQGNSALDCLQSYIDSLVELGRLDDSRLGINFWTEWKSNVTGTTSKTSKKKRKRSDTPSLASLSLHNSTISEDTINAMVKSHMGENVGVLDLTGVHTLTDDLLDKLLSTMPHLTRLSIKNCRRLTSKSLLSIVKCSSSLICLDIGGSYNISTSNMLEAVAGLPQLDELYAGGLGWSDPTLQELSALRSWKGLGIGFSPLLTPPGIREAFSSQKHLERLSIPFCEQCLENSLLGFLGRSLIAVTALDIRGNSGVNSLTSWYDGRSATGSEPQELFVLARYTNISSNALEETKRIHPLQAVDVTCIIDAGGCGEGIHR